MLLNLTVDAIVGSLPVVGDVFDLFFKANRRNLELIERYRDDPVKRRALVDYAVFGTAIVVVIVAIAIPFLTVGYIWSLFAR